MPTGLSELNRAFNLIPRRAEQRGSADLRDTFVDSGVAATLEAVDHQLMYGRRGTGKTHALRYLEVEVGLRGDIGVYVDLRTVGSPDGLFLGATIPATERAARLLVDLLGEVHEQLRLAAFASEPDTGTRRAWSGDLLTRLDRLLDALTTVHVVGDVEVSSEGEHATTARGGAGVRVGVGPVPSVSARLEADDESSTRRLHRETRRGAERQGLHFGDVARALRDITRVLPGRLWILLDEWSSTPLDVQPLLGEFLVRCVLPLSDVTVKIASLEQHTNFREDRAGATIGLEVGADITANVDLDEFMVFDQSQQRARAFLGRLLLRHLTLTGQAELADEQALIRQGFATPHAFDELVRASEGVPRDAINVVAKAAAQAGTEPISIAQVRAAARTWYQSDKEAALRSREDVRQLLSWIVDRVIHRQRCRGFLVNQRYADSPLLRILFDARVLHLIKRGYLAPQAGGERYDLWVIDYGAYVDLVGTESEPDRVLPPELLAGRADPRSIGRSVLDLEEYTQLPPLLDSSPTLGELLPSLHVTEEFGLQAVWEGRGALQVPVALVDHPYHQRRDTLWLDLSGAAGHVAICGAPQSGKSTLIRTLTAALALTHSPAEVGFYCLDFGGGTLSQLTELPHVGSVASRLDVDAVRRTVFELAQLLDDREQAFAKRGLDSIGSYRRMRRQGRVPADRYPTDVFLVIDGWDLVREHEGIEGYLVRGHEGIEGVVTELVARGLGFGIHAVVSVTSWRVLRSGLRDAVQTVLELRLGNPDESRVDRAKAAYVPIKYPGSGLSRDGLHMVTALPRIDGVAEGADLSGGVRDLIARVRGAWNGERIPPVRLLPAQLGLSELRPADGSLPDGIPIGLDEERLRPVHLHPVQEPHLAVFGAAESGKSNLLRVIIAGIRQRYDPATARILLVDYRRSLLDGVDDHAIMYAASGSQASRMLADARPLSATGCPDPT